MYNTKKTEYEGVDKSCFYWISRNQNCYSYVTLEIAYQFLYVDKFLICF